MPVLRFDTDPILPPARGVTGCNGLISCNGTPKLLPGVRGVTSERGDTPSERDSASDDISNGDTDTGNMLCFDVELRLVLSVKEGEMVEEGPPPFRDVGEVERDEDEVPGSVYPSLSPCPFIPLPFSEWPSPTNGSPL